MPQQAIDFSLTGDNTTGALVKLDNNVKDHETRITAAQTAATNAATAASAAQTAATNAATTAGAAQTTANTAKTNAATAQATADAAVPKTTLSSYGVGVSTLSTIANIDAVTISRIERFVSNTSTGTFPTSQPYGTIQTNAYGSGAQYTQLAIGVTNQEMAFRYYNGGWQGWCRVWHSANTTVDSNGFIKKAN